MCLKIHALSYVSLTLILWGIKTVIREAAGGKWTQGQRCGALDLLRRGEFTEGRSLVPGFSLPLCTHKTAQHGCCAVTSVKWEFPEGF